MFISNEGDIRLKQAFELYSRQLFEASTTEQEIEKITFSTGFEKRMKKLLSMQKRAYYYMINTIGKRVALIVLALIISLTVTTFSVKAIREAVIDFITQTFAKYTRVSTNEVVELDAADFIKAAPQYIPEGYEIETEEFFGNSYDITYIDNENNTIDYWQTFTFGTSYQTNTEGIEFETIYINSLEGIIYERDGYNKIVFADEAYFYSILGIVSREEIIKMAESIIKIN